MALLMWSLSLSAQNDGSIKGIVTENGKPVEFANAYLMLKGTPLKSLQVPYPIASENFSWKIYPLTITY